MKVTNNVHRNNDSTGITQKRIFLNFYSTITLKMYSSKQILVFKIKIIIRESIDKDN